MNENLDLTKILEGCPEGTKFYSSNYGNVRFIGINLASPYPIRFMATNIDNVITDVSVTKRGTHHRYFDGECTLFPSKDQRDWSKFERFWDKPKIERFDPKTWKVLDKVLFRLDAERPWRYSLFYRMVSDYFNKEVVATTNGLSLFCIPYNDDTKHLLDTKDDCPEYYKWWKE